MVNTKRWMGWAALAGLGAGCAPQPEPAAPPRPVLIYRLQQAVVAWGGQESPRYGQGGYADWNDDQVQPPPPTRHSGSGWGRHYPWRGPGQPPRWYGHTERHVDDAYVRVGDYYYPYYFEEGYLYPVYSMPYVYGNDGLQPRYGDLPAFGPYRLQPGQAHTLHHARGSHR